MRSGGEKASSPTFCSTPKRFCKTSLPSRSTISEVLPVMKRGVDFVKSTIQFELALTHNSSYSYIWFESTVGIFFTTRASWVGVRTELLPRDDLGSGAGGAWGIRKRVRIWGSLKWVSLKCSLLSFLALVHPFTGLKETNLNHFQT